MERKSILITGAASGIGRATARLFASKGWYIGALDLNREELEPLEDEIGKDNCLLLVCDITEAESYREEIEKFVSRTGEKLHALFNCAGVLWMGKNETIELKNQLKTIDVNLKGAITGINLALPYLKRAEEAVIISMSSNAAIYGVPELAVYSASKFGIRALTEALNLELEEYGITVSDIMAPYVNTPMLEKAETLAHSIEKTGIALEAEDVAEVVYKAVQGKKVHWKAHYSTSSLEFLARILPVFLLRPIVKYLALKK
jgi:NAD(P)-dependent dehydrogenase (short-subunit alcohol dehydrogenase family)